MESNSSLPIDLSTKKELPGNRRTSFTDNFTRLYSVKLTQEWKPRSPTDEVASGSALTSPFRNGEGIVMKQFLGGPETEKKVWARKRCENEYDKLHELNKLQKENNLNLFVMVLGKSMDMDIGGPFILLEMGNCSLGHLLHQRKTDCPTSTDDGLLGGAAEIDERTNLYTLDHCFTFIVQIFEALEFLHKEGMMHRDLKSYNVLLFNDKTLCKLCDFEDCRAVVHGNIRMTAKMGTTWWRAPEMCQNITISSEGKHEAEYKQSAEWYTFGLVMRELLFREEPFMCYYAGRMSDRWVDPSNVFSNPNLTTLPKKDEVDIDKFAMHFDTVASPKSPPVVLNKEKCVFHNHKDLFGFENVWSLIGDLLSWKPEDRPNGETLRKRVTLHIASRSTGSPPKILIPDTIEIKTDPNDISWKKAPSVKKAYFELSKAIQVEDRETIITQCKEVTSAILENVGVALDITQKNNHLRLTLSGEVDLVTKMHDYCVNNSHFSAALSAKFRFCSNERIKELEFSATGKQSVSSESESKRGKYDA